MDMLRFLKEDEDAKKIFGKQELKIIEKQLNGINLTQSEKNRLSRDIRKKLKFIGEVSVFKKDFELKKGSEIKKLIEETKSLILKSKYFSKIKRIVLFGSTVENKRTIKSDIDIAVEFDSITEKEAIRFRLDFSSESKVDVQVYNVLPTKIKKQIDAKGKLLYERKNKR